MMHSKQKQSGISVVEIMISVAISLILLAGVMQIFLTNKQTYRVQEAFSRLQENGRYAIQFLSQDIRMAGFFGCASGVDNPKNIVNLDGDTVADDIAEFTGNGLTGLQASDLPLTLNSSTTLTSVYGSSDILQIKRSSNSGIHVDGPMTALSTPIKLDPATATGVFQVNDILFVTDCEKADIFAVTSVTPLGGFINIAHANTNNIGNFLQKIYQDDAEVMKMVINTYYVDTNSAGVPALFRASMGNNASIATEELVEGVENMQLLYGIDTDDDSVVNKYVTSAGVADFSDVVNVRITLTIRTIEDNIARELTPEGDKRLRRNFTTSIAIRNRVS
ncbi:MAG: PilW family protein [Gammaproteobacteria bacterium]|jgi:type IV pilus assembly protein PilW|nr:PilW family protein [Gammaproteobacteria bacterium]